MHQQLLLDVAPREAACGPVALPVEIQESLVTLMASAIVTILPLNGDRDNEQPNVEREG